MIKQILNTLGLTKELLSLNLSLFLILVLSIMSITPMIQVGKYLLVLWGLFIIITTKYFIHAEKSLKQLAILGALYIAVCVAYWGVGISSAGFGYCVPNPFVFFSPIFALIVLSQSNDNQISVLFHAISLIIALNIVYSIWIVHALGLENVVFQSLSDAADGSESTSYGGAMYVNMVIFYANITFITFLKTNNKIEKLVYLFYFCISAYFIIICSLKASAVLLLLFSTLLQYIAYKGERNIGIIIALSIITLGIFYLFRDNIIDILINIIDSDRITSRLEVFKSGAELSANLSFAGREDLWMVSLQSWLKTPITFFFGIGNHDWSAFTSVKESGIGNHSDFFDVFARYGLLGGVIFYSGLRRYYKYLQNKYSLQFRWEIISFFVLVILMGVTKRFVAGEPAIIIFILLPLCLKHLYNTMPTLSKEKLKQ